MSLERPTPMPSRDGKNEKLFKVSEIATWFNVSPATVRRWIKEGKLKAIKMPGEEGKGQYRIERSELKRFGEHKFGMDQ